MKKSKKARLIYITEEQDKRLESLKDEITDQGGFVSFNQLFRDALDIMLQIYRDEVIWRYLPIKVEERSQR